jgi:2-dehydrotetronate isomerase
MPLPRNNGEPTFAQGGFENMPRFAANLSMMFQDRPFLERFAAAEAAGFEAVEYLFPYEHEPEAIRAALDAAALEQALFNLPPGDFAKGERGIAALPGREAEFRDGLDQALHYAGVIGAKRLHCMAGLIGPDDDRRAFESVYLSNLALAAERAAALGITILIEPINSRSIPGYFLNYQRDGRRIIERVGAKNLKLQLDFFHCQIMEGDLAMHLKELIGVVDHVQVAGVPERHEPDVGEINYPYLFDLLDEVGYAGWVGCEYLPKGRTEDGLGWFQRYRKR